MPQFGHRSAFLVALVSIGVLVTPAVIEAQRCTAPNPESPQPAAELVMVVVDSSGSMTRCPCDSVLRGLTVRPVLATTGARSRGSRRVQRQG